MLSVPSSSDTSRAPFPSARPARAERVFCFSILAETDPGVMPRVLELFAKRSLVPQRWVSDVGGPQGRELAIDLQVEGLSPAVADYLARCLRELHYVARVLTSEKSLGEKQPA